jgi:hypothetical protein
MAVEVWLGKSGGLFAAPDLIHTYHYELTCPAEIFQEKP